VSTTVPGKTQRGGEKMRNDKQRKGKCHLMERGHKTQRRKVTKVLPGGAFKKEVGKIKSEVEEPQGYEAGLEVGFVSWKIETSQKNR